MNPGNEKMTEAVAEAVEALELAVGKENVMTCDDERSGASVCVRPRSAAEVSKVVSIANKGGIKVVSSNNPSWAIDGTRFAEGGMIVDLSNFNSIIEIDEVSMSVKVGAGCKWKDIIEACEDLGFSLGSYPLDRSATAGSWAVANGIGYGSYKYGSANDNVLNLQVVTDSASIIDTGYDNIGAYMSGYNLNQLFSGSEGTLGIVTVITFKLHPREAECLSAYGFESSAEMQAAINALVHHPSIKPRNISWCGKNNTLVISLDGAKNYIKFEGQALDALMETAKGTKLDKDSACKVCKWVCCKETSVVAKAIVPVKNWESMVRSCEGPVYGTIADRSTALFISGRETKESLGSKAERNGGRVLTCDSFKWKPSDLTEKKSKTDLKRTVTPEIISELEDLIGKSNVNTNGVDRLLYSKDMAPLPKEAGMAFKNIPDVVVRPSTVRDIASVVRVAHRTGIPIVPRGNSSWGLGGCMPTNGGIVIDLSSKMNKIIEINTEEMYVKAGSGCTWKEVLDACMKKGYIIGSYPSSFPSATLGAWLATNGMGTGSYKYGSAKDNVLNLEVVLSDGSILETGNDHIGSYKAGYNTNQFFAGSEGTLCVFGMITFRIYPMGKIRPLAYSYANLKDMHETIQRIVRHPNIRPLHVSFSDSLHFENQRKAGIHAPDVGNVLLLTLQGDEKFIEFETAELDSLVQEGGGKRLDNKIADHEWEERCYEFRARKVGVGEIPAEVIVPVCEWGPFTDECYAGFKAMKMEAGGVIGVIVDRNTSLFMPYYFKDDESLLGMTAFAFNFYLGDVAMKYGGRTTGFGVFFAWNLDNIHDAQTVAYMRDLKTEMDPRDVVNPGHLVCGTTRFGINMNKQLMGVGSKLMQTVKKLMPANTTFADNKKRFRYDTLEHRKEMDRSHKLGDGTE